MSPDVNYHDLIGLHPSIEYTIFLAGITCRGEGVRGPGYRLPVYGAAHSSSPGYFQSSPSSSSAPFPIWAYGAVAGVVVIWLLIGFLIALCLRRRKSSTPSSASSYRSCCFSSTAKPIKHDPSAFRMCSRNTSNAFNPSIASSATKSSHLIPSISGTTQEYQLTSVNHHHQLSSAATSAVLQRRASLRNNNGEMQRLLMKGSEGTGEPTPQLSSSSASSPTNTACYNRNQQYQPNAAFPPPTQPPPPPTQPLTHNMVNSLPGFSPQNRQPLTYDGQWMDNGNGGGGVRGRCPIPPEVPPYASSNVLPPAGMTQSAWSGANEVSDGEVWPP